MVGSHPRHGATRGHVRSGQAWRRHTVGGTVVHKKEQTTKHSSSFSSSSSASQQKQQQHRKIQPSHVTYIPIEGRFFKYFFAPAILYFFFILRLVVL